MKDHMSAAHLAELLAMIRKTPFSAVLSPDGSPPLVKLLKLESGRFPSPVYIRLNQGNDTTTGTPRYLRVALNPAHFREELADPARGISAAINKLNKSTLFRGSGWTEFPILPGGDLPTTRCYDVLTPGGSFAAASHLLTALAS